MREKLKDTVERREEERRERQKNKKERQNPSQIEWGDEACAHASMQERGREKERLYENSRCKLVVLC